MPNAVVYRIEHDPQGRIVAVHYYDPDKSSHRVTGKVFILAANGIESPKLLLMSASDKYPDGLANSSGMVGRNLMRPSEQFADLRCGRRAVARTRAAEPGVHQHVP